jgi:hypothetical protein
MHALSEAVPPGRGSMSVRAMPKLISAELGVAPSEQTRAVYLKLGKSR